MHGRIVVVVVVVVVVVIFRLRAGRHVHISVVLSGCHTGACASASSSSSSGSSSSCSGGRRLLAFSLHVSIRGELGLALGRHRHVLVAIAVRFRVYNHSARTLGRSHGQVLVGIGLTVTGGVLVVGFLSGGGFGTNGGGLRFAFPLHRWCIPTVTPQHDRVPQHESRNTYKRAGEQQVAQRAVAWGRLHQGP